MRKRVLISLTGLMMISTFSLALQAQTKPPAAAKTSKAWAVPKTPWGDPDLQGTWTSDDCINTPMQRPANLGDKLYFTEEELAQRESAIARQAETDKQEF